MKIADFVATPDLVGRRVRISWSFAPEPGETLADVPHVCVRRQLPRLSLMPLAPATATCRRRRRFLSG